MTHRARCLICAIPVTADKTAVALEGRFADKMSAIRQKSVAETALATRLACHVIGQSPA